MNIKQFYDQDERRRQSDEVEFGRSWRLSDEKGEWNVFWVRDTGELVVMLRTGSLSWAGGGILGELMGAAMEKEVSTRDDVSVLLLEEDEAELRRRLSGWEEHHASPNGFEWLVRATSPTPQE